MKTLLEDGSIHMQTINYYHNLDSDEVEKRIKRSDSREGIHRRFDSKDPNFSLIIDGVKIKDINGGVDIRKNIDMESFIFCMTGLTMQRIYDYKSGKIQKLIPNEMYAFGDYCTVIIQPSNFLEKFTSRFSVKDKRFIDYVDMDNTYGKIGPFKKDISFQEQMEFRILVNNDGTGNEILTENIGDLRGEDVSATIVETSHLEEFLTEDLHVNVKFVDQEMRLQLLDFLIRRYESSIKKDS